MRKVSYIVERPDGTTFNTDNYDLASDVRMKNRIVKTILTKISKEPNRELKYRYKKQIKTVMAYYKAKAYYKKAMEKEETKA